MVHKQTYLSMPPLHPYICLNLFLEADENPGTSSLMIEIGSPANRTESQLAARHLPRYRFLKSLLQQEALRADTIWKFVTQ
jgi:hypothetical protein